LVAQILAASTHPGEVVEADRWKQQNSGLDGTAVARAVDQQSWDPSVKALTQFPLILTNMDTNLSWTRELGNAYESQPQSVLNAIQVMRQRAQQAGSLTSTPQEIVTTEGQIIMIQSTEPDRVFLPEYDPWLAYGAPVAVYPGWYDTSGLYLSEPELLFGLGIGIGAFTDYLWGYHHWRTNWHRRSVVYNHETYIARNHAFASHDNSYGERTAFGHSFRYNAGSWHGSTGLRYGGHNGFNHGGVAQTFAFHGSPGFGGGLHVATGGFHAGGIHGGGFYGGGFHGR